MEHEKARERKRIAIDRERERAEASKKDRKKDGKHRRKEIGDTDRRRSK